GDVAKTRDDARRVLPIEAHAGEDANSLVPKRPGRRKNRAMPEAEDQGPSAHLRWPPFLDVHRPAQRSANQPHCKVADPADQPNQEAVTRGVLGEFRGLSDTDGLARSGAHGTIVTATTHALHLSARRSLPAEGVASAARFRGMLRPSPLRGAGDHPADRNARRMYSSISS